MHNSAHPHKKYLSFPNIIRNGVGDVLCTPFERGIFSLFDFFLITKYAL